MVQISDNIKLNTPYGTTAATDFSYTNSSNPITNLFSNFINPEQQEYATCSLNDYDVSIVNSPSELPSSEPTTNPESLVAIESSSDTDSSNHIEGADISQNMQLTDPSSEPTIAPEISLATTSEKTNIGVLSLLGITSFNQTADTCASTETLSTTLESTTKLDVTTDQKVETLAKELLTEDSTVNSPSSTSTDAPAPSAPKTEVSTKEWLSNLPELSSNLKIGIAAVALLGVSYAAYKYFNSAAPVQAKQEPVVMEIKQEKVEEKKPLTLSQKIERSLKTATNSVQTSIQKLFNT